MTCTFVKDEAPEFASSTVTVDFPPDDTADGEKLFVVFARTELYVRVAELEVPEILPVVPSAKVCVAETEAVLAYTPAGPTTLNCR
jgi:hypothetical protein